MYEFTYGGLWLNWGALDRRSKWLASLSFAAAGAGAIPFTIVAGNAAHMAGYRIGYLLASGRGAAVAPGPRFPVAFTPALAWLTIALFGVSALLWWRFSTRQDEMFNRIQNWALGMGGAWTLAVLTGWSILALAGAAPPVSPLPLIALFWVGVTGFWFVAVRRWA